MPKLIKHFFEQSWLLIIVALLSGLAIATINSSLAPRIEQNKIDKLNSEIKYLLAETKNIKILPDRVEINIGKRDKAQSTIYKVLSASGKCLGWAFNAKGSGFVDTIELIIVTNHNFTSLAGFGVLANNETPELGNKIKSDYYRNQFKGAPVAKLKLSNTGNDKLIDDQIVAITGATISSQAVVDIINNYIKQVRQQLKAKGLIKDN